MQVYSRRHASADIYACIKKKKKKKKKYCIYIYVRVDGYCDPYPG